MRTDELLLNVILRRELGQAREVPKRTWHFLLQRHCGCDESTFERTNSAPWWGSERRPALAPTLRDVPQ